MKKTIICSLFIAIASVAAAFAAPNHDESRLMIGPGAGRGVVAVCTEGATDTSCPTGRTGIRVCRGGQWDTSGCTATTPAARTGRVTDFTAAECYWQKPECEAARQRSANAAGEQCEDTPHGAGVTIYCITTIGANSGLGALVAGGGGSGTGTTTPTTLTAPPVASVVTTSEIAAPAPETVRTETLLLPLQPGHFRTEQECRNAIIGQAGKTCLFSSPTDSWRIADQSETDTINQRNADDRSAEQQRLERAAAAQGVHVNTIIQREQRQQDLDAAAAERELSAQRPGAVVAESACTALPNGRFTQNRNGNYNCTFSHGPAHPCVATAIPSNNLFNVTRANSTMVACTLAIEIN